MGAEPAGKSLIAGEAWLDTLRIVRAFHNVTVLLPDGIKSLDDLPYNLHDAISAGLSFIGFDELPRDERPPRAIWWDADAMRTWWSEVERRREEKYGGKGDTGGGPMEKNHAVKDLVV